MSKMSVAADIFLKLEMDQLDKTGQLPNDDELLQLIADRTVEDASRAFKPQPTRVRPYCDLDK